MKGDMQRRDKHAGCRSHFVRTITIRFGVSYGRSSLKGGYRNITGKKARRDLNNVSLRLSCGPQKS